MIEDIEIYKRKDKRVYITEHKNPNKRTRYFSIVQEYDGDVDTSDAIGDIKWNCGWRRYTFQPDANTVWDSECMQGIVDLLREINKEHKKKLKAKKK